MCFIFLDKKTDFPAVSELSWRNKTRFHLLRSCERNKPKHPAGFFEKIPFLFNMSRNICHKSRSVVFKLQSNTMITSNELQVLCVSQNTRDKSIFHRSHWPIEDWVRHIRNSSVGSKKDQILQTLEQQPGQMTHIVSYINFTNIVVVFRL